MKMMISNLLILTVVGLTTLMTFNPSLAYERYRTVDEIQPYEEDKPDDKNLFVGRSEIQMYPPDAFNDAPIQEKEKRSHGSSGIVKILDIRIKHMTAHARLTVRYKSEKNLQVKCLDFVGDTYAYVTNVVPKPSKKGIRRFNCDGLATNGTHDKIKINFEDQETGLSVVLVCRKSATFGNDVYRFIVLPLIAAESYIEYKPGQNVEFKVEYGMPPDKASKQTHLTCNMTLFVFNEKLSLVERTSRATHYTIVSESLEGGINKRIIRLDTATSNISGFIHFYATYKWPQSRHIESTTVIQTTSFRPYLQHSYIPHKFLGFVLIDAVYYRNGKIYYPCGNLTKCIFSCLAVGEKITTLNAKIFDESGQKNVITDAKTEPLITHTKLLTTAVTEPTARPSIVKIECEVTNKEKVKKKQMYHLIFK